jgi:hypothetical protein
MPSLFKYFTIVGAILIGLLMLANSVLEPGGPKPSVVMATPTVIVKHDPRASLVERLRNDEAARDTAAKGETLRPAIEPVIPVAQPAGHMTPAKAEAMQVAAPAPVTTAPEDANARSVRLAKKKAERLRRQRLARERARKVQQAASQQKIQPYYGYAPQPTYGPFAGW